MISLLFSIVVAIAAMVVQAAQAYDIGVDMESEAFWSGDPVLFVSRHAGSGFEFTSDQREGAEDFPAPFHLIRLFTHIRIFCHE